MSGECLVKAENDTYTSEPHDNVVRSRERTRHILNAIGFNSAEYQASDDQLDGIAWLLELDADERFPIDTRHCRLQVRTERNNSRGGILGHRMGNGKTLQAMALVAHSAYVARHVIDLLAESERVASRFFERYSSESAFDRRAQTQVRNAASEERLRLQTLGRLHRNCSLVVGPSSVLSVSQRGARKVRRNRKNEPDVTASGAHIAPQWVKQALQFFRRARLVIAYYDGEKIYYYGETPAHVKEKLTESTLGECPVHLETCALNGPSTTQIDSCHVLMMRYSTLVAVRQRSGIHEATNLFVEQLQSCGSFVEGHFRPFRSQRALWVDPAENTKTTAPAYSPDEEAQVSSSSSTLVPVEERIQLPDEQIIEYLLERTSQRHGSDSIPEWLRFRLDPLRPIRCGPKHMGHGGPPLFRYAFNHLIVDEAHALRNLRQQTQLSSALFCLKRRRSWALTGTPVFHHDEQLWALMRFIGVQPLPPLERARQMISDATDCARRLEVERAAELTCQPRAQLQINLSTEELLTNAAYRWYCDLLQRYVHRPPPPEQSLVTEERAQLAITQGLQRTSPHFADERLAVCAHGQMPHLWKRYQWYEQFDTEDEQNTYERCCDKLSHLRLWAKQQQQAEDAAKIEKAPSRGFGSASGLPYRCGLNMVLRAQQAVTDPMLLPEGFRESASHSTKIAAAVRYITDVALVRHDEKVVVFCEWPLPLSNLQRALANVGVTALLIHGGAFVDRIRRIPTNANSSEKNANAPRTERISALTIDDRVRRIRKFRESTSSQCKVLLSTYVLESGIDLECANHVIFLEHRWVHNQMEQALARCYRKTQQRDVHVLYLLLDRAIDRRLYEVSQEAGALARSVIEGQDRARKRRIGDVKRCAKNAEPDCRTLSLTANRAHKPLAADRLHCLVNNLHEEQLKFAHERMAARIRAAQLRQHQEREARHSARKHPRTRHTQQTPNTSVHTAHTHANSRTVQRMNSDESVVIDDTRDIVEDISDCSQPSSQPSSQPRSQPSSQPANEPVEESVRILPRSFARAQSEQSIREIRDSLFTAEHAFVQSKSVGQHPTAPSQALQTLRDYRTTFQPQHASSSRRSQRADLFAGLQQPLRAHTRQQPKLLDQKRRRYSFQ